MDSVIGIAIGYGLDDREIKNFLFFTSSRLALWPTQPPIQWVPGGFFLLVKRPRREAHHSPPSSAEVKKLRRYTSTPPHAFMA
jgi:hypothetical protein